MGGISVSMKLFAGIPGHLGLKYDGPKLGTWRR